MNTTDKIKCNSCGKLLLQVRFSNTSIQKYHGSLRKNGQDKKSEVKQPTCRNCTTGNRHEMQCTMCEAVKDLEKFSKAQRKNTDNAKCLDCQQQILDREAKHADQVEEEKIMDALQKGSLHGSNWYSASAVGSRPSRVGTRSSAFETDTNPGSENWHAGIGEVPLPAVRNLTSAAAATDDDVDTRSNVTSTTQNTTFGINGGWEPPLGGHTASRRISGNASSVSRFVKAGAVRRDPFQKATEAIAREQRQQEAEQEQLTRESSDDDSDAEDDDDPY